MQSASLPTAATCVVRSDGKVSCWGRNHAAGLFLGGLDQSPRRNQALVLTELRRSPAIVPTDVAGLSDIRDIALGENHACALDHAGAVWCWETTRVAAWRWYNCEPYKPQACGTALRYHRDRIGSGPHCAVRVAIRRGAGRQ